MSPSQTIHAQLPIHPVCDKQTSVTSYPVWLYSIKRQPVHLEIRCLLATAIYYVLAIIRVVLVKNSSFNGIFLAYSIDGTTILVMYVWNSKNSNPLYASHKWASTLGALRHFWRKSGSVHRLSNLFCLTNYSLLSIHNLLIMYFYLDSLRHTTNIFVWQAVYQFVDADHLVSQRTLLSQMI